LGVSINGGYYPQIIRFKKGFSHIHINHPAIGVPPCMETTMDSISRQKLSWVFQGVQLPIQLLGDFSRHFVDAHRSGSSSYNQCSMDWFKGKSTGIHGFSPSNIGVSSSFSHHPIL